MAHTADSPAQLFAQLPGYTWGELIYQGAKTAAYRAVEISSGRSVVIKYLSQEYPSFGELVQFRNQYTITQNLPIPGIVRSLGLEPCGNGYALIMEDTGGISLEQYTQRQPLPLVPALSSAVQLAEILHQLHQHRVIHKDIKPANILIHPDSKRITLIDFSIASLLPKETQAIQSPKNLEGTLAYLAPEQTGRMNRAIDYRADFYALGVTLFQLLTGQLPFSSKDPMELIHQHIAQPPTAVNQINTEIPAVVADIVAKLMAKTAEDRYQSALGLKHDLEKCLVQWKEQGEIADFELGARDLCDRFLIPEKLYGRKAEVQSLLDAFERVSKGASELMLVAGFSGIGKTAVINEVHKPIVRQRGYFIKGKFDQFNRNIPFSAFVQSFRSLVRQLLSESATELQVWKHQILAALGQNSQVIIDLIPELEIVLGPQPSAPALLGTAAQNRFNVLFQKFIQVFTTPEHPLVIFVDDLQWADSASLNLIQVLMSESETGHLLLLGAYRDNEVSPGHPLLLTLDNIGKTEATVNSLTLVPLTLSSLNHLIADTLHTALSIVKPLTELVMCKTQGNPFFSTQCLKVLHQDGLINFDHDAGLWQCDLIKIQETALTDDVVELMAQQLQKLPTATQESLKLAACIGAQFDLETLAIVLGQSQTEVATALWQALQKGMLLPENDTYKFYLGETGATAEITSFRTATGATAEKLPSYRFLHDRVQQAAYSLIPDEQKQSSHLSIGRHLLRHTGPEKMEERLFDIVNQLNVGLSLISEPKEKETLLQLNLRAGHKAIATTAYDTAAHCLKFARKLLKADSWQAQYALTLDCYISATEAAYLSGDLDGMEAFAEIIIAQSNTLLDTAKVYEIKIEAYTNQGEFSKALDIGLDFLQALGTDFPKEANEKDFGTFLAVTQAQIADRSTVELLTLPTMTSATSQATLRILVQLATPAYLGRPSLYPLICFKQVQLSVSEGHIPASAFGYAVYGLLLSSVMDDITTGYEFGQLALQLLDRFDSQEYTAKVLFHMAIFIEHWRSQAHATLPRLQAGYTVGLNTGDLAYAGYSAYVYIFHSYFVGKELTLLEKECRTYSSSLENIKQNNALCYLQIFHQATANLLGKSDNPRALVGEIFNEQVTLERFEALNDQTGLWHFYACKVSLNYLFGAYSETVAYFHQAMGCSGGGIGMLNIPILWFYAALACCAQLADGSKNTETTTEHPQADELWALITEAKDKLQRWASHAPMNCQHRYELICAEEQKILENPQQALDLYDQAIQGAKAHEYIQEEAIANELAAQFYLNWGKEKVAAGYMQEAYYCYARWGAKAKVADLEIRYPVLLSPVLRSPHTSEDLFNTLMTIAAPTMSVHADTGRSIGQSVAQSIGQSIGQSVAQSMSQCSSSHSLNQTLDFASVLQASQALSGSIQLDELLCQLTQIMLQNSGGDRCALILPSHTDELQVRAIATAQETILHTAPLNQTPTLPVKLIQYVKNTQEVVVFDQLKTELAVVDDYLRASQPKSVLCLPILNQSRCIGILLLENHLTEGVFTQERIVVLNFLCTQAAISIENARLFVETLEVEASLRKSEKKLKATANSLPGLVYQFRVDPEGNTSYPYLSDRATELLEFAPHMLEESAEAVIQCIEPEALKAFELAIAESMSDLTPFIWTGRFTLPSGAVKWIEARSTPTLQDDGACLWDGVMLDVSDRKRAEDTVLQKSRDLEAALTELQNAQLKMVQSEKMSALGGLVAGVAHEINNPVGCIIGNVGATKHYIEDLLHLLDLYSERVPNPDAELEEELEDIDLDYVKKDLPKLIQAMKDSGERIKSISKSLRTFSRADTETKQAFDLREGLESTVLILRHRLKGNDQRPPIEVTTAYGEIPAVACFPGQLNQVFMNILANAIDALDDASQGHSFAELKANPNTITVCTELETGPKTEPKTGPNGAQQVKITISDNGPGIPEPVKAKIFEHLFTTKAVGKGTGLGLAIARQIVVESHGGTLEVQSEMGQGTTFCIRLPV